MMMMNSRLFSAKAIVSRGVGGCLLPSSFSAIASTTTTTTRNNTHQYQQQQQQQQQQYRTKKTKTGARGSRGHGWYTLYRSGRGGRHLQGQYYNRNVAKLQSINDEVFDLGNRGEFVYLDIAVGDTTDVAADVAADAVKDEAKENETMKKKSKVGRVVIQLASAALPVTTENFKQLCLAIPPPPRPTSAEVEVENDNKEKEEDIGYLHTKAHLIDKTIGIAFGDVLHNNGISGRCHPSVATPSQPYTFDDEHKGLLTHSSPGMVTMLSSGVHANDSRFLIQTVEDAPHLDGRYVAFGRVVKGKGGDGGMDFLMENVVKGVFTKRGRPTVDVKIVGCGVLSKEDIVALEQKSHGGEDAATAAA